MTKEELLGAKSVLQAHMEDLLDSIKRYEDTTVVGSFLKPLLDMEDSLETIDEMIDGSPQFYTMDDVRELFGKSIFDGEGLSDD